MIEFGRPNEGIDLNQPLLIWMHIFGQLAIFPPDISKLLYIIHVLLMATFTHTLTQHKDNWY